MGFVLIAISVWMVLEGSHVHDETVGDLGKELFASGVSFIGGAKIQKAIDKQ